MMAARTASQSGAASGPGAGAPGVPTVALRGVEIRLNIPGVGVFRAVLNGCTLEPEPAAGDGRWGENGLATTSRARTTRLDTAGTPSGTSAGPVGDAETISDEMKERVRASGAALTSRIRREHERSPNSRSKGPVTNSNPRGRRP